MAKISLQFYEDAGKSTGKHPGPTEITVVRSDGGRVSDAEANEVLNLLHHFRSKAMMKPKEDVPPRDYEVRQVGSRPSPLIKDVNYSVRVVPASGLPLTIRDVDLFMLASAMSQLEEARAQPLVVTQAQAYNTLLSLPADAHVAWTQAMLQLDPGSEPVVVLDHPGVPHLVNAGLLIPSVKVNTFLIDESQTYCVRRGDGI